MSNHSEVIEARKERRNRTTGLKPNGIAFKMALLAEGESMLLDVASRSEYRKVCDRVAMAAKTKVLSKIGRQYSCKLYVCRDLDNPMEESFIMRVTCMTNQVVQPIEEPA